MFDLIISLFLHLDQLLPALFAEYGIAVYFIIFLVIFCETGLVFTPFLPGDSLLFAAGALVGATAPKTILLMWGLLLVAAIVGDAVNYRVGKLFGKRLSESRWLQEKHITRANAYFERHGGKAIVLGRFLPFIRTFVPFVSGLSQMSYKRFTMFNIFGGFIWVSLFLFAGFWFGQLNFVKTHFSSIVLAIMVVSFIPIVIDAAKWGVRKKS